MIITFILTIGELISNNWSNLLLLLIFSILTFPISLIFHEYGHLIVSKYYIKKLNLNFKLTTKVYINIYPLNMLLSGGNKYTFIDKNNNLINLTDYLKENKKYKELIKIYSAGFKSQLIYSIIISLLPGIYTYYFFTRDLSLIIISILTIILPQLFFCLPTYLIAKNDEKTNDRMEIKKHKQIIKAEKENTKLKKTRIKP